MWGCVRFFWSRVECEAAVGSNVRSVPIEAAKRVSGFQGAVFFQSLWCQTVPSWGDRLKGATSRSRSKLKRQETQEFPKEKDCQLAGVLVARCQNLCSTCSKAVGWGWVIWLQDTLTKVLGIVKACCVLTRRSGAYSPPMLGGESRAADEFGSFWPRGWLPVHLRCSASTKFWSADPRLHRNTFVFQLLQPCLFCSDPYQTDVDCCHCMTSSSCIYGNWWSCELSKVTVREDDI